MSDTSEVERIRARVEQYRAKHHRWLELGQRTESRTMGMAEYYEREALERQLVSAWGITDIDTLLAHIDAQQAVIDAARAVDADVTEANWYEDANTYIVDAEKLEALHDAMAALEGANDELPKL